MKPCHYSDPEVFGRAFFYRCLGVVIGLLLFAVITSLSVTHLLPLLAPSLAADHSILCLITCAAVVLAGACGYLFFHTFILNNVIKQLSHLASLGVVSSQVAHDLRNPISTIKALVGVLHDPSAETQAVHRQKALRAIGLATHNMEHICEDLLAKRRGEKEAVSYVPLHTLLDELIEEIRANPTLSCIALRQDYYHEPILFPGRRNRIQRVFANIMKNAMEAMDFQGNLLVATHVRDDKVVISIQDNGPGMSPEQIEKIMNNREASSGKKRGNGLGMTFVQEVVQAHGGELHMNSTQGKGTTVHVEFPCETIAQQSPALGYGMESEQRPAANRPLAERH